MLSYEEYQHKKFNVCVINDKKDLYKQAIRIYGDESLYIIDKGSYFLNGKEYFNEGYFSLRLRGDQRKDLTDFFTIVKTLVKYYDGGVKIYWGENVIYQDGQNIDCQNINVIPDRAVAALYESEFGIPVCDLLEQKMQLAASSKRLAISMIDQENIGLSKDQLISFYYS